MVLRMEVNHVKFLYKNWVNVRRILSQKHIQIQWAIVFFVLLVAFGVSAGGTFAGALTDEEVVARLQERYNGINSIEADFEQETTLQSLNQRRLAEGKVYFKKPGRMRWNYIRPDKQEMVTDGEKLWIYMVSQKRVYRYDARAYLQSQLTLNFFLGQGNFQRDFVVSMSPQSKLAREKFYILTLLPRFTHPHVSEIKLWIGKDTFLIGKILTKDHLRNTNLLLFKRQRINVSLDDGLFVFAPPKGTEVIDG